MNPNGYLPSLFIDGVLLGESMAIAEYLEEKYPKENLLPKDLVKRARVRQICEVVNSGIQPLQNLVVCREIVNTFKGDKIAWGKKWNVRGLEVLEKILQSTNGKYCVGDEVTLADTFLVPQFKGAVARFKLNPDDFPLIKKICSNLSKIDAFVEAFPENQPDWPSDK